MGGTSENKNFENVMIFHEPKVTFKGVGTPKKIWGGYSDGSICEKLYLKKTKTNSTQQVTRKWKLYVARYFILNKLK